MALLIALGGLLGGAPPAFAVGELLVASYKVTSASDSVSEPCTASPEATRCWGNTNSTITVNLRARRTGPQEWDWADAGTTWNVAVNSTAGRDAYCGLRSTNRITADGSGFGTVMSTFDGTGAPGDPVDVYVVIPALPNVYSTRYVDADPGDSVTCPDPSTTVIQQSATVPSSGANCPNAASVRGIRGVVKTAAAGATPADIDFTCSADYSVSRPSSTSHHRISVTGVGSCESGAACEPLKADAGTYAPVQRADTVTLDGTASKGDIQRFGWTYRLGAGCPAGLPDPVASDDGATLTAKLLCSIEATLTVTDAEGATDSDTAVITVQPRVGPQWRVTKTYDERLNAVDRTLSPPRFLPGAEKNQLTLEVTWGYNACPNLPDIADLFLVKVNPFCSPDLDNAWAEAYSIGIVATDGPFRGHAYVTNAALDLKRVGLINGWMTPSGGPPKTYPEAPDARTDWAKLCPVKSRKPSRACVEASTNWYAYNSDPRHPLVVKLADGGVLTGAKAADYMLEDTRRHEGLGVVGLEQSGHMAAMIEGVTRHDALGDPRRYLESAVGPDTSTLRAAADTCLTRTNNAISDYAADPLVSSISYWQGYVWEPAEGAAVGAYRRTPKVPDQAWRPHPLELPECLKPSVRP